MPRFGFGRSFSFWTGYLWEFARDSDLADIQDRIGQLIGSNFESYADDIAPDYQELLISNIWRWLNLFRTKYRTFFYFLLRHRVLDKILGALTYYLDSVACASPLSLDSFNQLAENYDIVPTLRLPYSIAYSIVQLCDFPQNPDWESIHDTFNHSPHARRSVLRAVRRITGHTPSIPRNIPFEI